MKVKSILNLEPDKGTTFTEPSQTRQSDYEDINVMVSRIIRGEIIPQMPEDFEYDDSDDDDDILSAEHPLDDESYDFSDAGSLYQDDIRQGIKDLQNQQVTHRSESGAEPPHSSSDANVPVDNLEEKEKEKEKEKEEQ